MSLIKLKIWGLASLLTLGCYFSCFADNHPVALLGGQGSSPYASILYEDGSLLNLELPPTGLTYRVAMNSSGLGLIGGVEGVNAYAAFTSLKGKLTAIQGLMTPGEIYTVAINESGKGIIGGGHQLSNVPYAAFVNSKGSLIPLAGIPASGLIYGVAIDKSGEGIIGGKGPGGSAYAALTSSQGVLIPLVGLPATGAIFWVANNESKTKFIGGQDNAQAYAAFVSSNGIVSPVAGLPLGINYSVGLNNQGNALVGGTSLSLPYAALVSSDGTITTLNNLPTSPGIIYTVAINDAGAGLIGGFAANTPYSSFISPEGNLTPLVGLPTGTGFVDGLALHSSGVGLVGGTNDGTRFAALAAPNGTLTFLNGIASLGELNSISIASLDNLVPRRLGQLDSLINTQFTLSDVLTQHCMIYHKNKGQVSCLETYFEDLEEGSIWVAPFGNYVREKSRHNLPGFSNEINGALVGFDYRVLPELLVGAALGYAYNKVSYTAHNGNASINQESAVIYTTLNKSCFYMNLALWGGLYQSSYRRHSLNIITSKADPSGWNISPHFELSSPLPLHRYPGVVVDPFIAFDWEQNWQKHYHERGSSGFNLQLRHNHASILRSEIGLRLYETFQQSWGRIIVEEKLSYVNRSLLNGTKCSASFIGSASSFNAELLNAPIQNVGKVQLHVECLPYSTTLFGAFDYQGGFGSSYQSHMLTLTMGLYF